jgi:hypothetical protein
LVKLGDKFFKLHRVKFSFKNIAYLFVCVFSTINAIGSVKNAKQKKGNEHFDKKNIGYLELAGNAQTLFSLNYERLLLRNTDTSVFWNFRSGVGLASNKYDHHTVFVFPIESILLFGGKRHFAEVGIGCRPDIGTSNLNDTLIPYDERSNFNFAFTVRLGYRYVSNDGTMLRFSPVILWDSNLPKKSLNCRLSLGIACGISF